MRQKRARGASGQGAEPLINGAEGIAVGMATSIPPHNFGEVVDGVIAYMKILISPQPR